MLCPADLRNLANEAALLAGRDENEVRAKDSLDALEKIVLGPERPLLLSPTNRERIAYHNIGHAILGLVVRGADAVHRLTIVPRRQVLGVTSDRYDCNADFGPSGSLRFHPELETKSVLSRFFDLQPARTGTLTIVPCSSR